MLKVSIWMDSDLSPQISMASARKAYFSYVLRVHHGSTGALSWVLLIVGLLMYSWQLCRGRDSRVLHWQLNIGLKKILFNSSQKLLASQSHGPPEPKDQAVPSFVRLDGEESPELVSSTEWSLPLQIVYGLFGFSIEGLVKERRWHISLHSTCWLLKK